MKLFQSALHDQKDLKWQEGLAKFRQIAAFYPQTQTAQKAHIEIGKFYKYNRNWQRAIDEYRQAIAIDPYSRPAHDARTAEAATYYFRQDFPRALELFEAVLLETKDWDQIKYCSYWIKEIRRRMSFAPEESFSCGPESLKIAFRILGIDFSDKELSRAFTYKEGKSVSISDLSSVASGKGLKPKIVKINRNEVQNLTAPFIALVDPEHYVVVTGIEDSQVKFIDPANQSGYQLEGLDKFIGDFKGYALIFLEDSRLAKANYVVPTNEEAQELKGGICSCCPPAALGGRQSNPNVEFDGSPPCSPGMPSWMVNMISLNLVVQDIDFRYISRGVPAELIRTYNGDDPREGIFGRSWTFNYNVSLVENSDSSIDIRRGDGRVDHFTWTGVRYQGPNDVYDTLAKNADGTYTLKIKRDKTIQDFDAWGRLIDIKDRNDNAITFTYNSEANLIRITDPNGKNTVLSYGANRKVSRITLPDGRYARFIYDTNNNLIQTVDMKGATSSYTYDSASYITAITTPHRGMTAIEYGVGSYGEDPSGRSHYYVKSITDDAGNKRRYAIDEWHHQTGVLDSRNNTMLYEDNLSGYTSAITTPSGNKITFIYDYYGNREKIIDASGNVTVLAYDSRGNTISITDTLNNKLTLDYDTNDNLIQAADPKGGIYNFNYDGKGNLISVRDPENQITGFAYNNFGQINRIVDANGGTTDFEYDTSGNLINVTNPSGRKTVYKYDTLGRVRSLSDPEGNTFSYTYDGVDHLTRIDNPDEDPIKYFYNCCNITRVRDGQGTMRFTYDALGRMRSFRNYDSKLIAYEYDTEGNLSGLIYPDGKKVSYEYDKDSRLIKVTDWLGNATRYNYDAVGNLISVVSPGLITTYKYDSVNRLIRLANYNSNTLDIVSIFNFTLDPLGNRTQVKRLLPLNIPDFNIADSSYSYNSDNQLTSATGRSFEYDDNGNLTRQIAGAATTNFTYNHDNQLTQYTSGSTNLSYRYDSFGNRIRKTQGSQVTKYIVDPNRSLPSVLCETDAKGNISAYYIYGLGLISKIIGNNSYFYQYDGLGSTIALSDSAGAIKNKYAYDDFGNLATNSTETIDNPFKYVGRFGVMTDTPDLLYMKARYYMPSVGRFISKDPIGLAGGMNMYGYVGGNPINLIDPWGLRRWGPRWIEIFVPGYGFYGGPFRTDPNFQVIPEDTMDELFMEHDRGWASDQCSISNKGLYYDLKSLPLNPNRWKRKSKSIVWAVIYSMGATAYFFWF
ncbi:MAG: cysteine peptidase family C39 domain-containing protein [Candidatus Omnitrophica bacterium]|nr:cysteine peptidase family C39 domain-containing protein [Candidatus Omnitrophota bacterium]